MKQRSTPLPALLLNIPAIMKRSPDEVARQLGPATGSARMPGRDKEKVSYRSGSVQVAFADGRAVRVVIRNAGGLPYSPRCLSSLGLPVRKPDHSGQAFRWDNLCGMADVAVFPDRSGGVSHVFVALNHRVVGGSTRPGGRPLERAIG